jgi:hypothetical protein
MVRDIVAASRRMIHTGIVDGDVNEAGSFFLRIVIRRIRSLQPAAPFPIFVVSQRQKMYSSNRRVKQPDGRFFAYLSD